MYLDVSNFLSAEYKQCVQYCSHVTEIFWSHMQTIKNTKTHHEILLFYIWLRNISLDNGTILHTFLKFCPFNSSLCLHMTMTTMCDSISPPGNGHSLRVLSLFQCNQNVWQSCFIVSRIERLGDPHDEIVTIFVHKFNIIMLRCNFASWRHLIRETHCQDIGYII